MSNPLYNQYNNSTMQSNITKFNNQLKENYDQMQKELEQKFNSFANWFKGNPRQVVQNLLNSGRFYFFLDKCNIICYI